jgi:D-alanyl-D-alanine carboxypeptidase
MMRIRSTLACFSAVALLACTGGDPLDPDGSAGEGGDSATVGGGSEGGAGEGGEGDGGSDIPAVEDPFDPPPEPSTFSEAELADLKSEIDGALASASASYSARIVGLDSKQVVYEKNAGSLKKPASNTKMFTTAASLVLSGESGAPEAGLYAAAIEGGVVQGDLVLFGQHDPLTTVPFGAGSRQSLDAAADVLVARGVTAVTGGAVARGEFLYEGNSLGTISFTAERQQAADAFRAALVAAGISVAGGASTSSAVEPPGDLDLVLPMPSASHDVIAHAINVPSHNEMADLLLHHLGVLGGGASTYAAGFVTVASVLDDIGAAHEGLLLNDGSGLSHDNRVSATHITNLLSAMEARADWSAYVHSMAISGLRGTIAGRMTGGDTAGRFWGKTGTLTGVVALSGVLFHKHDGQRYLVSLLANDVGNSTAARAALDGAVNALAKNRKGGAGLLSAPRLTRVADDQNGKTALVEIEPVDGASGYLMWRSADGRVWKREDARLIGGTKHRTMSFDGSLFVRVTAVNDAGESAPSAVLGARVSSGGARALFVDANQRYASAPVPENPLGWGNDAVVAHAAAISGPFESCASSAIDAGAVDLAGYGGVFWALGRESTADETFSSGEQGSVRAFVEGGGKLFVSGAEVAYDLIAEGSAEDASFASEVLGIEYVADDAGTTFVGAGAGGVDVALARFSKLGLHEVSFPDVLAPAGNGQSCLDYLAGATGAACIETETDSGGRVIVLGFPLESLDDPTVGAALAALLE